MTYEEFSESVVVEPMLDRISGELERVEMHLDMGMRLDYSDLKRHGMKEDVFMEHAKRTFYQKIVDRPPLWLLEEFGMDVYEFVAWCRQMRRKEELYS